MSFLVASLVSLACGGWLAFYLSVKRAIPSGNHHTCDNTSQRTLGTFQKRYNAESDDLATTERAMLHVLRGHRRIVELLHWTTTDAAVVLHLERCDNGDLATYVDDHRDVSVLQRTQWAVQVSEGLAWMHEKGVVWADCNPTNILLTATLEVRLSDFEGCGMRELGLGISTLPPRPFCAPDSTFGLQKGYRIDIYAFGMVFLDLLLSMGRDSPTPEELSVAKDNLDAITTIPDVLRAVIADCLADRYPSGKELNKAMADALHELQQ